MGDRPLLRRQAAGAPSFRLRLAMPVLNAPERGARWHATHDVIAEANSKAVELLKRIEQTHDMHSSVMGAPSHSTGLPSGHRHPSGTRRW